MKQRWRIETAWVCECHFSLVTEKVQNKFEQRLEGGEEMND